MRGGSCCKRGEKKFAESQAQSQLQRERRAKTYLSGKNSKLLFRSIHCVLWNITRPKMLQSEQKFLRISRRMKLYKQANYQKRPSRLPSGFWKCAFNTEENKAETQVGAWDRRKATDIVDAANKKRWGAEAYQKWRVLYISSNNGVEVLLFSQEVTNC